MQNILVERIFDKLRERLGTSFFSDCLLEVIKGEVATLIMVPVTEAQDLGPTPKGLTASELSSLRKKLRAFAKWQGAPDTKRALKSIPRLSISDLTEAPRPIPRRVYESEGATVLCHEGDTSGILYFDLYFDVSDLDAEEAYRLFDSFLREVTDERPAGRSDESNTSKSIVYIWIFAFNCCILK